MVNKKDLMELLTNNSRYECSDEPLLNAFFDSLRIYNKAKQDITKRGILTACDKEGKILQQNPSIAISNMALGNMLKISRKFGLSPRDRAELRVELEDDNDGFDK